MVKLQWRRERALGCSGGCGCDTLLLYWDTQASNRHNRAPSLLQLTTTRHDLLLSTNTRIRLVNIHTPNRKNVRR